MKIIISLLFLILYSSLLPQFINGFELVFLNLTPHSNSGCTGIPEGNGYSIIIDTCLSFDNERNYVFTVRESLNTVSWTQFESIYGEQLCNKPTSPTQKVSLNSCIPFSMVGNLNLMANATQSATQSTWYSVTISKNEPVIPSDSFTTSMTTTKCTTIESENALLYSYYTNGTWVESLYGGNAIFFCLNGIPYSLTQHSTQPPAKMSKICWMWAPFFNSSYEVFPPTTGCYTSGSGGASSSTDCNSGSYSHSENSQTTASGCYTGSGGPGCNSGISGSYSYSGSNSGSNTGSTSGSNSGSDSNDEVDMKIEDSSNSGGSGSEPTAYQSIYCT